MIYILYVYLQMYIFLNFIFIGVFVDYEICILPATYKGTPADGNGNPEKERILVPWEVFALCLHCICLVFVIYVHCISIVFSLYLSYICIVSVLHIYICFVHTSYLSQAPHEVWFCVVFVMFCICQPMAIASQKRKRCLSSTYLVFDCIYVLVCITVQHATMKWRRHRLLHFDICLQFLFHLRWSNLFMVKMMTEAGTDIPIICLVFAFYLSCICNVFPL